MVKRAPNTLLAAAFSIVLSACTSLPENDQQIPSYRLRDTSSSALGMRMSALGYGADAETTGAYFLGSGVDAFVARAAMADKAEESIDAQYYLFHRDVTGKILLQRMHAAAERGVRVRLLVDDMDLADLDEAIAMVDAHPNFEVRIWNPFIRGRNRTVQLVTRFGSVTRRMHNKSFTIDNQLSIIGGRNIGDEYFEADPDYVFGDMDVALIGSAVPHVSDSFDAYWNHQLAYPISTLYAEKLDERQIVEERKKLADYVASQKQSQYAQALLHSDLVERLLSERVEFDSAKAEVYADSPDKILRERDRHKLNVFERLRPHLNTAQRELIIVSPYFVPGRKGVRTLTSMAGRGVRVRILTNSLASTDVSIVHAGYSRYRKALLQGGVELYELDPKTHVIASKQGNSNGKLGQSKSSLHAKSFVIDREKTFVGSLNLDPRSVVENTEIGVLLFDERIGNRLAETFDARIEDIAFKLELNEEDDIIWLQHQGDVSNTFGKEPYTSFWARLKLRVMKCLPAESQL